MRALAHGYKKLRRFELGVSTIRSSMVCVQRKLGIIVRETVYRDHRGRHS